MLFIAALAENDSQNEMRIIYAIAALTASRDLDVIVTTSFPGLLF